MLLKVYELLRPHFEPRQLIEDLAFHAQKTGIVIEAEAGEPVAVAFAWHIDDPYDLVEQNFQYPGENPIGKYLYLPLLFVRQDHRTYSYIVKFLKIILRKHPGARRIVFVRKPPRDPRLHILMKVGKNGTIAPGAIGN